MKYLRALLTVYALGALALGFVGVATILGALNDGNLPLLVTGIIVLALGLAHAFQTVELIEVEKPDALKKAEAPAEDEGKADG